MNIPFCYPAKLGDGRCGGGELYCSDILDGDGGASTCGTREEALPEHWGDAGEGRHDSLLMGYNSSCNGFELIDIGPPRGISPIGIYGRLVVFGIAGGSDAWTNGSRGVMYGQG
jgi:hypothetical protein